MDIIEILGYIYCMLLPTFVIYYIGHECIETLHNCSKTEDEEDF